MALLFDLGRFAYDMGDLRASEKARRRVLEVRTRTLPDDHPDLQKARLNMGVTMHALGDLAGAKALLEKVIEVDSRTLPDDDPNLLMALQDLAVTIEDLGDLTGARALEEKILEVRTRTLPDDHADLQAARGNLADTLRQLGDLAHARPLEEKVLEVRTRTLPDDHADLQLARQNLGATIHELGDLAGARALFEKVLEVRTRTLPDDHPDLQQARQNLASTMYSLGELTGARALLEKVLEVRTRTLPDDHPDLQWARGNLALPLKALGDLAGARALEEKVLEIRTRTLPDDNPDLQTAREGLAGTLYSLGELASARALFEKVLEVRARSLPDDHPDLQFARLNLATTIATESALASTGRTESAKERDGSRETCSRLIHSVARSDIRAARAATLSSSSRETEERCSSLGNDLSSSLSFAAGHGVFDPDPVLARDAFVLSETTRSGAIASARLANLARSDERYAGLRKQIETASEELARLVQSGGARDAYDVAVARRDRAQQELVQLASKSAGGAGLLIEPDPEAFSDRLANGDAIVAYRRYARWGIPAGARTARSTESLCAFVLREDQDLKLVDLGAIEPIEAAVKELRTLLGMPVERGIGAVRLRDHEQTTREKGEILRRLVFDPLLPALGHSDHLIVALDDVLHCVPINALPVEGASDIAGSSTVATALLGDRYRIEERLSLTEIGSDSEEAKGAATLVALGGASFNSEPLTPSAEETASLDSKEEKPATVASVLRGGAWERGFEPLTYTGLEAREIAALFEEAQGATDRVRALVLEKRKASRAAVEELAPKARFLHLATHGWFAPESVRSWSDPEPVDDQGNVIARISAEERVKGSSPMLLCGLALAGANLPADAIGRYPGLITAEEISGWNLSDCDLAVLSACDTNVGERRAGQGVASLQKALHMAGARTVITSLWKVPDEATLELMVDFYRRLWVEKQPKWLALWEAKKKLREAKDERGLPKYSTRDWAAWVLTGDPN